MSKREKVLATGVAGLLVLAAIFYGWSTIGGWIGVKQDRLTVLERQLSDERFEITAGEQAESQLAALRLRSLPGDPSIAKSVYQQNLLELANELALKNIDVSVVGGSRGLGYQELSFKLKAFGDLRQLTLLLYQLRSSHTLQRVSNLTLKPVRESKLLDIDITVQALVLDGAEKTNKLPQGVDPEFVKTPVDAYVASIVGRNLFARENQPPRMAAVRETAHPGESVTIKLKGSDPDKLDDLSYRLAEGAPADVSLDADGNFRWKSPAKLGDYTFKVVVADDGLPAKTTEAEIHVAVEEKPAAVARAPKAPDDNVLNTFVTAITGVGDTSRVWFSVRTTGETLKVELGEKFKVGNYTAEVKHIGDSSIEVVAEGRHFLMALGESFADAVEIPKEGL